MFDIGADELLLTAVVAIVVIGPKDLPRALRVAGRWVAKMRRMSNAFRAGFETMVREAEMEELEREWTARNAAIMAAHPAVPADHTADHTADQGADQGAAGAAPAAPGDSPRLDPPAAPAGGAPAPGTPPREQAR